MNLHIFNLKIVEKREDDYLIEISNAKEVTRIGFDYSKRNLIIPGDDQIAAFLKKNDYQINKILRNKRKNTFYEGFELTIVLRDKKDVEAFNDKSKIIVLDKRKNERNSYVIDHGKDIIVEVFTDGSFKEKFNTGGFSYIIKDLEGEYTLYKERSNHKSSSLIELEAAIAALEKLKYEKYIRIITDSQYVRKGLTEWILNWQLNGWKTANGYDVKNKKYWLKFDKLTKDKYIEFEWVKAHSDQFENTLADLYAGDMATLE